MPGWWSSSTFSAMASSLVAPIIGAVPAGVNRTPARAVVESAPGVTAGGGGRGVGKGGSPSPPLGPAPRGGGHASTAPGRRTARAPSAPARRAAPAGPRAALLGRSRPPARLLHARPRDEALGPLPDDHRVPALHDRPPHPGAPRLDGARVPPRLVRGGRRGRDRARRPAHARRRPAAGLGARPPRHRLELLLLRAGSVGELRRVLPRPRLHPRAVRVGAARLPRGGRALPLGPPGARRLRPEPGAGDLTMKFPLDSASPDTLGLDGRQLDRLHELVTRHVAAGRYPAAQLALARPRTPPFVWTLGDARLDPERVAARDDTLWLLYSNTKVLTACAVWILAERGALAFTDKVPHPPPASRPHGKGTIPPITLLTHQAAFPNADVPKAACEDHHLLRPTVCGLTLDSTP